MNRMCHLNLSFLDCLFESLKKRTPWESWSIDLAYLVTQLEADMHISPPFLLCYHHSHASFGHKMAQIWTRWTKHFSNIEPRYSPKFFRRSYGVKVVYSRAEDLSYSGHRPFKDIPCPKPLPILGNLNLFGRKGNLFILFFNFSFISTCYVLLR